MNLTLTLKSEILLLSKYKITSNELMLIRTLLLLQDEGSEELFQSYIEALRENNIKLRDILLSLQNKGIILKQFKIPDEGISFSPCEIPLNKIFLKNLYRNSFEMGKELFEVYPQFTTINGNLVPLRSIAKKFDSLEDAYGNYGKSIRWNPDTHKEIIELVKWANENNLICCSLSSFLINNGWLDLKAIKEGDKINVNYDSIRIL